MAVYINSELTEDEPTGQEDNQFLFLDGYLSIFTQ